MAKKMTKVEENVAQAKKLRAERKAKIAEEKTRKESLKKRVFDMEQENYSRLIAYADGTTWYKLGGHSALIYYHEISRRLKLKPRLNPDTDFYSKFQEGVVNIRSIDTLKNNLKTLKIYPDRELTVEGELYIFDIGYKISEEKMDELRHKEETRRTNFNKMIVPKISMPEMNAAIMRLLTLTEARLRKMSRTDTEYYGKRVNDGLIMIYMNFMFMCNGRRDEQKALLDIVSNVEKLKAMMKIMLEVKKWPLENALLVGDELVKIERLAEKRLKTVAK